MLKSVSILLCLFAIGCWQSSLLAQVGPPLIPFQGRLTDQNGVAVSNGVRLVQFKVFQTSSSGSPVWAGELHRTTINGGLVNVLLGSKTPLAGVDFDRQLYLEITVDINADNAITAADPPMLPRQVILPVVFAKESANSRQLAGYDWSDLLNLNDPVQGTMDGSKLADRSIAAGKLSDGSMFDRHVGTLSHLTASDGDPARALSVDADGNIEVTYLSAARGVEANGPAGGGFSFAGHYREGKFMNWLGTGSDPDCIRLLGAGGESAGGYGFSLGGSIASPVVWFYAFEDRNCFQVRSVDYDFGTGRSQPVPNGTPLFTVRRRGGAASVGIGIENPASALDIDGQGRASSGFVNSSDRNVKRDFAPVDCREVLERLNSIPIRTWSYTNDTNSRHIGPVSQDFNEAFQVGSDDKTISTVDASGVAFAAIQGLSQVMKEQDGQLLKELQEAQIRKDQEIKNLGEQIRQLREDLEATIKTIQKERR